MAGAVTRGVLFVHSAPRALCPHVEWAAGNALGVRVSMDWTAQLPQAERSIATSSSVFAGPDWHFGHARVGSALFGVPTGAAAEAAVTVGTTAAVTVAAPVLAACPPPPPPPPLAATLNTPCQLLLGHWCE